MAQDDKQLFIGLDVGTDSVGWAATDEEYNLYRLKGKTAWGARIFDAASNAKERRGFRVAGRRLARRKERIRLLNTLFDPLLAKKDPTFLLRLEHSSLQDDDPNKPEDAKVPCLLFKSKEEEKAFYKRFPTIWHLRRDLINNVDDAFSDIRYLYLAIHHIVKYRGNFIRQGDIKIGEFDNSCFDALNDYFAQRFYSDDAEEDDDGDGFIGLPKEKYADFLKAALDKGLGKAKKKQELIKFATVSDHKQKPFLFWEMFCSLCSGSTFSTKKLNTKDEEIYEAKDIAFNSKYDDNEDEIRGILGDDFEIVELAKAVFDYCDLSDIIGNHSDLSSAFAALYDSHKEERACLKRICQEIDRKRELNSSNSESVYFKIFKQKDNPKNYSAFVQNGSSCDDRCDIETFNKYIMETIQPLETLIEDPTNKRNWERLKVLAGQGRLFQTIALRSTSVIPMQLHKKDLKAILENACKRNIPGIPEIKDKILALFEYHIPYYCGPLSNKSPYTNVVFKDEAKQKILPWNYKDLIDFEATKQKFMMSLTNKCTYLKDCDVLPLQSLLYQSFDAWNKLNNLMVNGGKLGQSDRETIFKFASGRNKTTLNDIKRYLIREGSYKGKDLALSGWNQNDFINLSSHACLKDKFDLSHRYTTDFVLCERAIFLKAIFTDSPKDAEEAIKKEFPDLKADQLNALKKVSCKGWATLSKEFLTLRAVDEDGVIMEGKSILQLLEDGEGNLMQILHDERFHFQDTIKAHNAKLFADMTPKAAVKQMIDDLPPQTRRPVIQAIRIVQEVSKVAKKDPDVIAVEVTRENNDSKKKKEAEKKAISRKKQLEAFLSNLAKDPSEKQHSVQVKDELGKLQDLDSLRGKHLFLYFLQNGKDLYSGKPIDINDVLTGNRYDTDHIIPQSLMKDDSIDNLVLVEKAVNQHRSNEYPLPASLRNESNVAFWRRLKKAGCMSEKKYNNLMRATPLSEEELASFVAAQINVVNRSNMIIRDALQQLYPNAKLIFSKAQYPSQIRRDLDIPKLRDLNDTHHAVDAFLNVVCGVELTNRFGKMSVIKAMAANDVNHSLNMERYIGRLIQKEDGEMTELGHHIFATSQRHDFLLTYRFAYQDGAFYKGTIYKAEKGGSLINTHDDKPAEKYGGYSSLTTEYNCIATIKGKKKTTRYLLGVPHLLVSKAKDGVDISADLKKMVPHKEGDEVSVDLQHPVPLKLCIKRDGIKYLLMTKNAAQVRLLPISPVFLSIDSLRYFHKLAKFVEKKNETASSCSSFVLKSQRADQREFIFDPDRSKKVALELFSMVERQCFDYCNMISGLRNEDTKNALLSAFETKSLKEQYSVLREMIAIFTRLSEAIGDNSFRKSRGAVLQDGLIVVSQSITGLYETERPL